MSEVTTYPKILRAGLQETYDAMETHDSNILYFCTNTGKIYKGDIDFTASVITAATKPAKPIVGKVYILADSNTVEAYVNGSWKVISYPAATTVDATSDDMHYATAKAVYDAIQSAVEDVTGGATVVKSVEKGTIAGTLKVTKGDNTSDTVTLEGLAAKPTWDATARKLTIPVVGEDTAVEVNFGKDIFLDTTAENKYNVTTKAIELYLNDGSGEEKPPTKISIPAAGLIDVYTGVNTNGAHVSVSDDNKIKVDIVVDPVEGNALQMTETGLKVSLAAYSTTEEMNAAIKVVQDALDELTTTVNGIKTAVDLLNGEASEEGSVKQQIASAKTALESSINAVSDRVTTLESDNETNKTTIDGNTKSISALAAATTTWGTFTD